MCRTTPIQIHKPSLEEPSLEEPSLEEPSSNDDHVLLDWIRPIYRQIV